MVSAKPGLFYMIFQIEEGQMFVKYRIEEQQILCSNLRIIYHRLFWMTCLIHQQ